MSKTVPPDWRHSFPGTPRPSQVEILDEILNNWDYRKHFAVDAPTGVGKSRIAATLVDWLHSQGQSTYVVTASTLLEDQYVRDFPEAKQVHSSSHYRCGITDILQANEGKEECDKERVSCQQGANIRAHIPGAGNACVNCPYAAARDEFYDAKFPITNIDYLLFSARFSEEFPKRNVLIVDEAHNLPEKICNLYALEISAVRIQRYSLMMPALPSFSPNFAVDSNQERAAVFFDFLAKKFVPKAEEHYAKTSQLLKAATTKEERRRRAQELARIEKDLRAVENFAKTLQYIDDWVITNTPTEITLKPVFSEEFAAPILSKISDRIILLSATLLAPFIINPLLDLDPEDTHWIFKRSPFPVENRPVHLLNAISWTYDNKLDFMGRRIGYREHLPFAAQAIQNVLDLHPNERGIILVNSRDTAQGLLKLLNNPRIRTHNKPDQRAALLEVHRRTPNSVILSYSMHEGVDLRDDDSRFCIIDKIPRAAISDPRVCLQRTRNDEYYSYAALLKLVQSFGRSVRSETDSATTYILDRGAEPFFETMQDIIPEYIQEAI